VKKRFGMMRIGIGIYHAWAVDLLSAERVL
jgi:hypothetical protein